MTSAKQTILDFVFGSLMESEPIENDAGGLSNSSYRRGFLLALYQCKLITKEEYTQYSIDEHNITYQKDPVGRKELEVFDVDDEEDDDEEDDEASDFFTLDPETDPDDLLADVHGVAPNDYLFDQDLIIECTDTEKLLEYYNWFVDEVIG